MLRAASAAKLPVMSAEARATVLAARKGVESPTANDERWRMMQSYYLETR